MSPCKAQSSIWQNNSLFGV